MVNLEIPAFIIGLNGLAGIFDRSCLVWKTIVQAQNFGEDVADWMRKLEMEFFRFQTWWTALEHLSTNTRFTNSLRRGGTSLSSSTSPLVVQLRDSIGHPITNAAESVLKLLEEIEAILQRNGVLAIYQQQPLPPQPVLAIQRQPSPARPGAAPNTDFSLQQDISQARVRQRDLATDLLKKTPWIKRYKHDVTPWKTSDKTLLEGKLASLIYWNQSLYDILPQHIRDSVLRQGISGYILDDDDEAEKLSKLGKGPQGRDAPLSESANLLSVQRRFRDGVKPDARLEEKLKRLKLKAEWFTGLPVTIDKDSQYSVVKHTPGGSGEFVITDYRSLIANS
jgi:hypothetical protein